MKLQRDWITPITMGAFGLLAATGVLMFFHIDSGLNEAVHEWLSWVLLGGVALHAARVGVDEGSVGGGGMPMPPGGMGGMGGMM
mgnify:CR=1 FL=1